MANQITNNLTIVDAAEAVGSWSDIDHGTMTVDAETVIFVEGSGSVADRISGAGDVGGIGWDYGVGTDLSTLVVYMWAAFTTATLLEIKASGGVAMRFTGPTSTDFFEVYLDGFDTYGGGFKMNVVDVDLAAANPDLIGGTPPATTAIQWAGMVWRTTGAVLGSSNTAFVDVFSTLAPGVPGIIVEGDNTGTPWNWQDIVDAGDVADPTKAWGTVTQKDGVIFLNTPVQFGISDVSDHDFSDVGAVISWEDRVVADTFYGLSALGNVGGTTNVTAGTKVGTGASAVGVNGWTIITGRPPWTIDMADVNQDGINFYGCSFNDSREWTIDDPAVEILSCTFTNCATLPFTAGTTGPAAISKCFFSAAPGPRAQCVIGQPGTPTDFASNQFIENSFVNMLWFGMEFTAASPISPGGMTLQGFLFSNNGAGRDILASNDTGDSRFLITGAGDSPTVTNGSTVNITTVGTVDNMLYTIVTFDEVQQVGGGTDAQAIGVLDATGNTLTVDDDTFAIWAATPFGDLISNGTGDNYTDDIEINAAVAQLSALIGYPDGLTPSVTARRANATLSVTAVDAAVALIEVTAETPATPVSRVDPAFRPWVKLDALTTTTFGYGSGDGTTNPNRKAFAVVVAQAGVAADTAISTITVDTGAGTTAFSSREVVQDDNVAGTGNSLEISVFSLANTDASLDQGNTPVVEANVTTTFSNIRSDSELRIFDTGTSNELAGTETVVGELIEAQLTDAGSGYIATETLTIVGGTFSTAAVITIDTVDGGGAITGFSITTLGSYTVDASSPNSPSGGTGTGAEFAISIRGSFPFTFNAATQGNFDIVAHHLDFVYLKLFNLIPATSDGDVPINQRFDRNFDNPI
jgi:hypothetical protein